MEFLAKNLGYILKICYELCNNYLFALVLFTLITKIILIPVSIWVQKNGIKLVKITPKINNIKCKFYGEKEMINNETFELYKKEKYNPFLSLIPLVAQLVLLMGVIEVVKLPAYAGMEKNSMFSFGIDFSLICSEVGGAYFLFPVLAALSAFAFCVSQNKSQVLQAEQGKLNKYGMMALSVALSLYLGLFVSGGVAAYWILSNLFSIAQTYILNAIINPKKYIDYEALEESRKRLEELNTHGNKLTPELKKRQRCDYKRFFSIDNKHIVFYSEQSGFYKYYSALIRWLTSHSNITIHYVTSDPEDVIFRIAEENKKIKPYYIGENKLITMFLKMDSRIVVMTMPDLENYHIKRSIVNKNVEYIYMDHGLSSMNLLTRKGSLDHFDTVFSAGQHINDEIRAREKLYSFPKKNLVNYGYGYMDELIRRYAEFSNEENFRLNDTILIAPSHQEDNILDSCLDLVVNGLKKTRMKIVIRPHPQYIRRKHDNWNAIIAKYKDDAQVETQSDFSSDETVYCSSLVVTDWSNIGYEYAFSTLRPVLLVDTPMKVINPDYEEINIVPIDIILRNMIGISVSGKDSDEISKAAAKLLSNEIDYRKQLTETREKVLFNVGNSTEVAGKYILSQLTKGTK
ncbi:MAG: membrane protein insertase YidC [Ruminococcus sp.]|nr:membrane protein insertase YidC [Ruminococcus sp.]